MARAAEPFPLLELPDATVGCVFSQLTLREALSLGAACKALRALSGPATHRRYACARCKHALFDPAVVFNAPGAAASPALPLHDGRTLVAQPEHLEGAVLGAPYSSDDSFLRCILLVGVGGGRADGGAKDHCTEGCRGRRWARQHPPSPISASAPLPLPVLQCKLGQEEAGEAGYEVRVQNVSCGGCGLYLGLRLLQLGTHKLGECE